MCPVAKEACDKQSIFVPANANANGGKDGQALNWKRPLTTRSAAHSASACTGAQILHTPETSTQILPVRPQLGIAPCEGLASVVQVAIGHPRVRNLCDAPTKNHLAHNLETQEIAATIRWSSSLLLVAKCFGSGCQIAFVHKHTNAIARWSN